MSNSTELRQRLMREKKYTESQWVAELRKLDPSVWRRKLLSTRFFEKVYRISSSSMRMYRAGYYFKPNGEKYYITELHESLAHLKPGSDHPSADPAGGAVKTTIPWMNDWLRKIGKEDRIPTFLKHL